MKISLLIIFAVFLPALSFSQQLIVKSSFDNIQYAEDVEWYNDDIYCAGFTFKTQKNDGNSSDAYLINYDTSLKPKWSIKVSDKDSNKISSVIRYKDKIYALVTQGKVTPSTQDVFIRLFIISLDGIIENKVFLGRTFHSPSNISIEGGNLIFGNKVSDGINYSSPSRSEIIKYNIATKKIVRLKSSQYLSRPKKIIAANSNIFLSGIYLHKNQPNIMSFRNGKYSEISLSPNKEEYFLDSYINKNILTIVCAFPGVYGDMKKYLKFYYVNLKNNTVNSKSILYTNLGWEDVRFSTFSNESSSWLIVKENDTKAMKYVLIDSKGNIQKTLNFDTLNGNSYVENYIIKNNMLLNANSSGIQLYKTE